eukprot:6490524-Amphidinium_carterae.2
MQPQSGTWGLGTVCRLTGNTQVVLTAAHVLFDNSVGTTWSVAKIPTIKSAVFGTKVRESYFSGGQQAVDDVAFLRLEGLEIK